MNKSALTAVVSTKIGLSQRDARAIIDSIFEGITEGLAKGERLEIRGLGTFETRRRMQRTGRIITSGEKVVVPPRRVPVFIPGKVLKRIVNQ